MTDVAREHRAPDRPSVGARAFDALDIAATALFGLEGAAAAAHAGFDLLGVIVVGLIVALAGGVLRDVLLGDLPPAALRTPSRIVAGLAGALAAFVFIEIVDAFPQLPVEILDAVGLALFAVIGAQKASASGANLWVVTILGTLAATGGGVIRDVLLARTPYVLSESIYGSAAAAGAVLTGILLVTTRRPRLALGVGFAVTFALRLGAVVWGWSLPRIT
ncbi:MAG: TRIC cation channel family protein [Microbacterium enclense]